MNLEHLRAVLWLRWRLKLNQVKRGGTLNAVLGAVLAGAAVATAVGAFATGLVVGASLLPRASPAVRLYVWDGIVLAMLFSWTIGLLAELQRAEGLSLDRFLHLPVSPAGAFLINYLGTWLSLTTILFVPGLVGLTLGGTVGDGPLTLLALPLVAAFLFALTALTYQFQGWLASIMTNPRRRRTVVVLMTGSIVLLSQAPSLLNIAGPWRKTADAAKRMNDRNQQAVARMKDRVAEMDKDLMAGRVTPEQYQKRSEASLAEFNADSERVRSEFAAEANPRNVFASAETVVRVANVVLPPGWLPLGAAGLAAGDVVPALLGGLGLTLVGTLSLRRAYRTTLRLYRGEFTASGGGAVAPAAATTGGPARLRMTEWAVPRLPEAAVGVAAAGLRSLTRAPEVKMLMIAPVMMAVVFGGMLLSSSFVMPAAVRPFIAAGAAGLLVLPLMQLVGNQFGYDRNGFRAYVLSPVPRRDILLGKNLSIVPLAFVPALFAVVLVAVVYPMRVDHCLAALVQPVSMFLLSCLVANGLSIYATIPIPAGGFKPAKIRAGPALAQGLGFFAYPILLAVTLVPMGAELLLAEYAGLGAWPVGLGLSLLGLAAAAACYRFGLAEEGRWLAAREQAMLEVVTSREE